MNKIQVVGTIARAWKDNMNEKFVDSLAQLLVYEQSKLPPGQVIHYMKGNVSWHELMRNEIAREFLGDWLFMIDTDHCFAPDILERLMRIKNKYKCQVLSGIYQYKFNPHMPVMNLWKQEDNGKISALPITAWDNSQEILEVGPVPGGCLLVDRQVFKHIIEELKQNPFDIITGLSEDYSFCYRCKQLGIPVYMALQVECHHVINHVLSIRDYQQPENVTTVKSSGGIIVS